MMSRLELQVAGCGLQVMGSGFKKDSAKDEEVTGVAVLQRSSASVLRCCS